MTTQQPSPRRLSNIRPGLVDYVVHLEGVIDDLGEQLDERDKEIAHWKAVAARTKAALFKSAPEFWQSLDRNRYMTAEEAIANADNLNDIRRLMRVDDE